MLKMNKPEWFFIVAGCFACLINGGIQPSFGIILSELIAVDFLNILFYSLVERISNQFELNFKRVSNFYWEVILTNKLSEMNC